MPKPTKLIPALDRCTVWDRHYPAPSSIGKCRDAVVDHDHLLGSGLAVCADCGVQVGEGIGHPRVDLSYEVTGPDVVPSGPGHVDIGGDGYYGFTSLQLDELFIDRESATVAILHLSAEDVDPNPDGVVGIGMGIELSVGDIDALIGKLHQLRLAAGNREIEEVTRG